MSYTDHAPGIDPLIGVFVRAIAALILIIGAIVYGVCWVPMFICFSIKNGPITTAQTWWDSGKPSTPTNHTI
jgi:hypothetical protein